MKQPRNAEKSVNLHEEYHGTLRTKSYLDFSNKVQLLANKPSIYSNQNKFSEILLEPCQSTIPSIIDATFISKTPELKNLMLNYFDNSAEASLICGYLLKIIKQVQCHYHFIERAFAIMDDHDDDYSPEKIEQIIFELNSFISSINPLSNLDNDHDFKLLSDKNSSVLHDLKSMRKKVGRKIKLMTCVTTSILNFACKCLKRKFPHLGFSRRRLLGKICDQVDMAAMGTYILTKDFDTMGRLVARLDDEIEHNMFMVQFCLDEKDDKFSLQIVKELKKSGVVFGKLVEELTDHVNLCLVTINRARCLVIKEVTETSA